MFCTKCGRKLVQIGIEDRWSNWGKAQYDDETGRRYKEITLYSVCPKQSWWRGHDKFMFYVTRRYE